MIDVATRPWLWATRRLNRAGIPAWVKSSDLPSHDTMKATHGSRDRPAPETDAVDRLHYGPDWHQEQGFMRTSHSKAARRTKNRGGRPCHRARAD